MIWLATRSNLLRQNGHIVLEAQQLENEIQVKVRDDGPGIPPEEQKRIFDAFSKRLRKSGEGVEGTGLAWPLLDSLVKLQGGTLPGKSPGRGVASTSACRLGLRFQSQQIMGGREARNK